ncbi:Peptide transporter family 1 [Aphelenchoides bicaudatus]|nr:Peptide transporter family 1 [Aphelenchoides bicaudatus]
MESEQHQKKDPLSKEVNLTEFSNNGKTAKVPATEWLDMIKRWPKLSFLILFNEFCERFAYYGMRTVLFLYFLNILGFTQNHSVTLTSVFMALCYTSPIFGTILILSVLYFGGQLLLTFSAMLSNKSSFHPYTDILALIIIALGTGGIKPCVAPFGGDQFVPWQTRMISIFFSVFYFSINAGSMISTLVTPMLRSQSCLNKDSCYSLSFGVPTAIMLVAIIAFAIGSPWYIKTTPSSNIFKEVFLIIKQALINKRRSSKKQQHWLDHYLTTHRCVDDNDCKRTRITHHVDNLCAKRKQVNDVKRLLRILVVFLPGILFWFMYDQQASKWVSQAINMDCRLWGTTSLLADQMQVVNAVLILVLIPVFQAIYSLLDKCVNVTPLRKMVAGCLVASLAFFVAGAVQIYVNRSLPILPSNGKAYVSVINSMSDCEVTPTFNDKHFTKVSTNTSLQATYKKNDFIELKSGRSAIKLLFTGSGCTHDSLTITKNFKEKQISYIHVNDLGAFAMEAETEKPTGGNGEFSLSIVVALDNPDLVENLALCNGKFDPNDRNNFIAYTDFVEVSAFEPFDKSLSQIKPKVFKTKELRSGKWEFYYMNKKAVDSDGRIKNSKSSFAKVNVEFEKYEQGGVYVVSLSGTKDNTRKANTFRVVDDNHVRVFWQLPQIFIITSAEILLSITGLEFAFTQSAPSMKSIVQGCWLTTVAFGDVLLAIVNATTLFTNQAVEYFVYGVLMLFNTVALASIAIWFYKSDPYSDEEELKFKELNHDDSDEGVK